MHRVCNTILLLSLVLFSRCTKDKSSCTCCGVFSRYANAVIGVEIGTNYNYGDAFFNPNNSSEFVCLRYCISDQTQTIIICNLNGIIERTIYSSKNIWSPPRWGLNDWLVFSDMGMIYKIKASGDSLTQLSFSGRKHFPAWNYNATKIIYNNESDYHVEIMDENGAFIEQLSNHVGIGLDWSLNNGTILLSNSVTLFLISGTNYSLLGTIDVLNHSPNQEYISQLGLCWIDNNNIVWTSNNNINKVNIINNEKTVIKKGCEDKAYSAISISNDRRKILAGTHEFHYNNGANLIEEINAIYLMNIDGSEELKIELPKK